MNFDLRSAVLQAAIQGNLTDQRPEDGTAEELLEQIHAEKKKLIIEGKIKREKALPPITEDEKPFDIPENWCWVRLQAICSKIVDGDHTPPAGLPHKTEYIMLSALNVNNNSLVNLDKVKYLSKETFEYEDKRIKLNIGDVLLTIVGTLGRSCIYEGGMNVCFQRSVAILTTMINSCFLKITLDAPNIQSYMIKNSTGTAQKGFYLNQVSELTIPLPPLAEQERIVERVEALMSEIDDFEAAENELEGMKAKFPEDLRDALLQAAIQGNLTDQRPEDGTAEKLLERIRAEKEKLIAEGKIKREKALPPITDDEKPFDIPKNWVWVRLNDVGYFVRGNGIKRAETTESGKPCIRYGQLYTTFKTSFTQAKSFVPETIFKKAIKVHKKDVLMALTGENNVDIALAVAYFGEDEIAMGGDMTKFTHNINPMYIVTVINSAFAINYKSKLATGNMIVHISNDKLASIPFPLPPLAEQERIVERLNELLPLCERMKQ